MVSVQVVTGYIPIQGHPRTAEEYGKLGEKIFIPLVQAGVNAKRYMAPIEDCWLHKYVSRFKTPPAHSVADNPAKNTLAYHIVQHQKFGWLLKAAIEDPRPDVYVWLDYGIGHVPGVEPVVIGDFLDKIGRGIEDRVHIPGCWPKDPEKVDFRYPCWRFCGGVVVVPRRRVHKLYKAIKTAALKHIDLTKNVEWEVNTMARAELANTVPFRWYQADHNETMFTGFPDAVPADNVVQA
jgi:hypothetical protein